MRARIIFWAGILVVLVAVVTAWASLNDRVTDRFARTDMQDDVAAMKLTPDPAPQKSAGETLQNPRIVTVTRGQRTYKAVVMNVLAAGCSVVLERSRTETRYHLELVGDQQRKVEVYTPVAVWHNSAPIDLMQYDSQADAFGPEELGKFLRSAVGRGADLPCLTQ